MLGSCGAGDVGGVFGWLWSGVTGLLERSVTDDSEDAVVDGELGWDGVYRPRLSLSRVNVFRWFCAARYGCSEDVVGKLVVGEGVLYCASVGSSSWFFVRGSLLGF
jgi:hypothetical protein